MTAIIIAAGMGSRLNPLTNDRPKCMLDVGGKTLLERQIETLKKADIDRIVLIKGYKKETISRPDLIYYVNNDYRNNDILYSLFYAEDEMTDAFIAIYSDIIYDEDTVKKLLANQDDISIAVDIDWKRNYEGRRCHSIDEAEKVIFNKENNLVEIGKAFLDKDAVNGEFIGMIKCSRRGAHLFKGYFNRLKKCYSGKPFRYAPVFEKAYLTDMLQEMADSGIAIRCVTIRGGWNEIDTMEDYERLRKQFSG